MGVSENLGTLDLSSKMTNRLDGLVSPILGNPDMMPCYWNAQDGSRPPVFSCLDRFFWDEHPAIPGILRWKPWCLQKKIGPVIIDSHLTTSLQWFLGLEMAQSPRTSSQQTSGSGWPPGPNHGSTRIALDHWMIWGEHTVPVEWDASDHRCQLVAKKSGTPLR